MTDQFEPSRKLDALSPELQAWGEALTDRISAISGNAQLAAIEAIDKLRVELVAERHDRALVVQFLERQEAAAEQQRADFRALLEVVRSQGIDIADLKKVTAEHERKIVSFEASRDQSIAERREHAAQLDESRKDRAQLRKEGNEWRDEARTRFDKQEELIRLVMEHLGLSDGD